MFHWWVYPFLLPLTAATVALVVFTRMRTPGWPGHTKLALIVGVAAPYLLIIAAALLPGALFTRPITAIVLTLLVLAGLGLAVVSHRAGREPRPAGNHEA